MFLREVGERGWETRKKHDYKCKQKLKIENNVAREVPKYRAPQTQKKGSDKKLTTPSSVLYKVSRTSEKRSQKRSNKLEKKKQRNAEVARAGMFVVPEHRKKRCLEVIAMNVLGEVNSGRDARYSRPLQGLFMYTGRNWVMATKDKA